MLIAEIGNCHYGSMRKAKELIRAAHNSGADLIKAQAFVSSDIKGSMPPLFYKMCELSAEQCLELIHYARDIGNDLFFSIFSDGFKQVSLKQNWHKVAGSQTNANSFNSLLNDTSNTIISVPSSADLSLLEEFEHAEFLHVSRYLTDDPELWRISHLKKHLNRELVGYSDHTIGIVACQIAHMEYDAHIIEKHFCLKNDYSYLNTVFRDSIHGITPHEFEKLAFSIS